MTGLITAAELIAEQRPLGPDQNDEWFLHGVTLAEGAAFTVAVVGPVGELVFSVDTEVSNPVTVPLEEFLSNPAGYGDLAFIDALDAVGGYSAIRDSIAGVRFSGLGAEFSKVKYRTVGGILKPFPVQTVSVISTETWSDGEYVGRQFAPPAFGQAVEISAAADLTAAGSRTVEFKVPDGYTATVISKWTPASGSAATNTFVLSYQESGVTLTPSVVSTSAGTAAATPQSFPIDSIGAGQYRLVITAGAVDMDGLNVRVTYTKNQTS